MSFPCNFPFLFLVLFSNFPVISHPFLYFFIFCSFRAFHLSCHCPCLFPILSLSCPFPFPCPVQSFPRQFLYMHGITVHFAKTRMCWWSAIYSGTEPVTWNSASIWNGAKRGNIPPPHVPDPPCSRRWMTNWLPVSQRKSRSVGLVVVVLKQK